MDGYRKKIKKKKMKTFLEAVIDIPRRTYAKGVFDEADTDNPKIKASVKAQIDKQIEEFEKEYPVVKIGLIGSILTKSCLLYTSPSPRDRYGSRMPSSA